MSRTPKHILKYQAEVIAPVIDAKRREIDERLARLAAEMGYVGSAETGYVEPRQKAELDAIYA